MDVNDTRANDRSALGAALVALALVGSAHLMLWSRMPRPVVGIPAPAVEEKAPVAADELAYIDDVVQALSAWDKVQLKPLLAPETLAGSSDVQLDQVLHTLGARLGALQSYTPPTLEAHALLPGEPKNLTAYRLLAYYDRGTANLSLLLKRDAGARHLYSFNVEVAEPQ
jgi:hypothetical protein